MTETINAIIISFNDYDSLVETINSIKDQVDLVTIVDNGSEEYHINKIKNNLSNYCKVIELEHNKGIGAALNIGVLYSIENSFDWVLTLDQDSISSCNLVSNLLDLYRSYPDAGMTCPSIDGNIGIKISRNGNSRIKTAITSGNLIKTNIFLNIGLYNEEYFIDNVDFEFCLRLINHGYTIHMSNSAQLRHSLGTVVNVKIFLFQYKYISHNPNRRYYIFRNNFYISKQYFKMEPILIIKKNILLIKYFIEILIFDKHKFENIKMINFAVIDFMNKVIGKNPHEI